MIGDKTLIVTFEAMYDKWCNHTLDNDEIKDTYEIIIYEILDMFRNFYFNNRQDAQISKIKDYLYSVNRVFNKIFEQALYTPMEFKAEYDHDAMDLTFRYCFFNDDICEIRYRLRN
jgi:hypothetical protein